LAVPLIGFFQAVRVFKNRVLKKVIEPNREEVTGRGKKHVMKSLIFFYFL
jgi:hypothetical protein